MSPEYAMEGIFSEKSDVFSFGVLVLEILSGRKNSSFFHADDGGGKRKSSLVTVMIPVVSKRDSHYLRGKRFSQP